MASCRSARTARVRAREAQGQACAVQVFRYVCATALLRRPAASAARKPARQAVAPPAGTCGTALRRETQLLMLTLQTWAGWPAAIVRPAPPAGGQLPARVELPWQDGGLTSVRTVTCSAVAALNVVCTSGLTPLSSQTQRFCVVGLRLRHRPLLTALP